MLSMLNAYLLIISIASYNKFCTPSQPATNNIHLNVTNNNSNQTNSNMQSTQKNDLDAKNSSTLFNAPFDFLSKAKEASFSLGKKSINTILDNKWKVSGIMILLVYGYLNYKIEYIHNMLENPNSWLLWKEEIPLSRLITLDRKELCNQIKIDFFKKNFLNINPPKEFFNKIEKDSPKINFLSINDYNEYEILTAFLKEINNEKNLLQEYKTLIKNIHFLHINQLCITTKKIEQIDLYIQRLNFLIDLYLEDFFTNQK